MYLPVYDVIEEMFSLGMKYIRLTNEEVLQYSE